MIPVYCEHCNRANSADAPRCIWCGLPVTGDSLGGDFETTRIEIEYLGGIDRLDDPAPVKLAVGPAGIEINEIIPGSRNVKIAADQILDAQVEDASTFVEGERRRRAWWWYLIWPIGSPPPAEKPPDTKRHDYILTITYESEGDVRKATFRRDDRPGLSLLTGLARIIGLLVRRNQRQKS